MGTRRKRTTKKKHTANAVLIILGLFTLAFIVTMIVTFWVKGSVPDTLIQCTLNFGGFEAAALAGIRISKVISGAKYKDKEVSESEN